MSVDRARKDAAETLFQSLSPTEELVLDVLAARHRLGETLWTFKTRYGHAIWSLQDRGLIEVMHGVTEGTVRASLTDTGKEAMFSASYVAPLVSELEAAQKERSDRAILLAAGRILRREADRDRSRSRNDAAEISISASVCEHIADRVASAATPTKENA